MVHTGDQPDPGWEFKFTSKAQSSLEKPLICQVPPVSIIALEHPCIIKNTERGIETLGGISQLQKLVDRTTKIAQLNLKPGNRESAPIKSNKVQTNDIVLRITIPKKTGLKRKRGSDGPFQKPDIPSTHPTNETTSQTNEAPKAQVRGKPSQLLQSLRASQGRHQIEVAGRVGETHRFRAMPDFVFSTTKSPFMSQVRNNLLPFDFKKMKDFKLDMSRGVKPNTEIIPPVHGSNISIPFNYGYLENTMVRPAHETTGQTTTKNISLPRKQENQHTQFNALHVPTGPSPLLPPLTSLEPPLRRLIIAARDLFTERPIYTRRALFNSLPPKDLAIIGQNPKKHIQQYVGYVFKDGPWSKSIIRFGVDPRKDPDMRIYQTLTFNLIQKGESGATNQNSDTGQDMGQETESHIFDGTKLYLDGKMWQVCDITDPLLAKVFATDDLRKECHMEYDGWFRNGTLAKARVVMRHKLLTLRKGESVDDKLFEKVLTLPESYDSTTALKFGSSYYDPDELSKEEKRLIEAVRQSANRSTDGPVGRVANGEMEEIARDGDGDEDEENEEGDEEGHRDGDEDDEDDEGNEEERDGGDDERDEEEEERTREGDGDGDENEGDGENTSPREEEAVPADPMLIDEDPDPAPDDTESPLSDLPSDQSTPSMDFS